MQDCMLWMDAAKGAFENKRWYLQEYENYLKMGGRYSKEAERCWEEVQRIDEEFNRYVIEASICLLGAAKVYLKGIEYTQKMFRGF